MLFSNAYANNKGARRGNSRRALTKGCDDSRFSHQRQGGTVCLIFVRRGLGEGELPLPSDLAERASPPVSTADGRAVCLSCQRS